MDRAEFFGMEEAKKTINACAGFQGESRLANPIQPAQSLRPPHATVVLQVSKTDKFVAERLSWVLRLPR